MQSRRRLVHDVELLTGLLARQGELAGDLESLRFAARESRRWLAQSEIAQADLLQLPQRLTEPLFARTEPNCLVDGQLEDIVDAATVDFHVEHFGLESLAAAIVARHEAVGHEHHLDLEIARPLARLTSSASDVEAERACGVLTLPRERRVGENTANFVERLHVRDGIRARRLPDRALIDHHHAIDRFGAGDTLEGTDRFVYMLLGALLSAQPMLECTHEHVVHERAFSGARDAGDAGDRA